MQSITEQMSAQLNKQMPEKYNLLLNSMRRVPLNLYNYLTTRSSKGVVSSFLYSSAGDDMWDMNNLLNTQTEDVLIIPPLIYPPGLTFSFLRYNQSLKMNIVYSENSIGSTELNFIENELKELLLGVY